jgi:hypothetical protein
MQRVLVEVHLATGRQETTSSLPGGVVDSIYARHGIDSTAFDHALQYYSRHPARLSTLYDGVLDTLSALRRPDSTRAPSSQSGPDER